MMTFEANAFVGVDSIFTYYSVVATTRDGGLAGLQVAIDAGKKWYANHIKPSNAGCICCVARGNVDDIIGPGGPVDVNDLTYLVSYLFQSGAQPPCEAQGNVDGIIGAGGSIDVNDLTYLVAYLFQGGPTPPVC